jgi:hypothetical protein
VWGGPGSTDTATFAIVGSSGDQFGRITSSGTLWTSAGFPPDPADFQVELAFEGPAPNYGVFNATREAASNSIRLYGTQSGAPNTPGEVGGKGLYVIEGSGFVGTVYEVTPAFQTKTVNNAATVTFTAAERTAAGYTNDERILVSITQKTGNSNIPDGFVMKVWI